MSSSLAASSAFAQQVLNYTGIPIFVVGMLGELLNIIVFLSLHTFRSNSCAMYLTVMSFVNIGQLLTSLLPRIMVNGYAIDWTLTSLFYCKFRVYSLQLCILTSLTCMCLATIDQFLTTSSSPYLQRWSNVKLARGLCALTILVWILHGIPYLIFYDLFVLSTTNQLVCAITNPIFGIYYAYVFVIIFIGFLPMFITILFGLLAYRNVQQLAHRTLPIVRRELDKQLTVMVLVQVLFNLFALIPYIIVYTITLSVNAIKYPELTKNLQFASSIFLCFYYLYYACPFYIYVCVSERFRQQLVYVLFEIHLNRWRRRDAVTNQVSPQA